MSVFFQFLLTGLTVGSVYTLVGLGYNIIYNTTSIINLAQGEFVVIGGLLMWFFTVSMKMSLLPACLLTILSAAAVGLLMERLTIRPVKSANLLLMIMITISVAIIFRGILMIKFGKDPFGYAPFSADEPIIIFGAVLQSQALWVMGATWTCIGLLYLFMNGTMIGKAMSACAINPVAARLSGINVSHMVMLAFVISAVIGAIGGITITPITLMEYDKGPMLAVKGFCAAILGGLGKSRGAVVGGLTIGILESMTAGYLHSGIKDAVALIILLIILFFRPAGIFGNKDAAELRRF